MGINRKYLREGNKSTFEGPPLEHAMFDWWTKTTMAFAGCLKVKITIEELKPAPAPPSPAIGKDEMKPPSRGGGK